MHKRRWWLDAWFLISFAWALAPGAVRAQDTAARPSGLRDFDFQVGEWRVQHRVKRPTGEWMAFDGTCRNRGLIDGSANVEEHTFRKPGNPGPVLITHGIALRAYDPATQLWAIWWVDSRDPHGTLDPPVKGRFENGVGTFYSDYVANGKPMRVRYIWSGITATAAHWEQAASADGGKTWDTNWTMEFQRVPSS